MWRMFLFFRLLILASQVASVRTAQAQIPLNSQSIWVETKIIDEGSRLDISAAFEGTVPVSYRWRHDGVTVATGSSSGPAASNGTAGFTYSVVAARQADAGTYMAEATNAAGTASNNATMVIVRPPFAPLIVSQPAGGQHPRALFAYVSASGTPPLAYQWLRNGVAIPGQTQPALATDALGLEIDGLYTVEVSNALGRVLSEPARIVEAPLSEVTMIPNNPAPLTVGQSFTLNALPFDSPYQIQWQKNGADILGATQGYLDLAKVQLADAADYSATITGLRATAKGAPVRLTVVPPVASRPVILVHPRSQTLGANSSPPEVQFVVALENDTEDVTFAWRKDGQLIPRANGRGYGLPLSALAAGNYDVVVTNGAGSTTSRAAVVSVASTSNPIVRRHPASQAVRAGGYAILSVELGSNVATKDLQRVEWRHNGVLLATVSSLQTELTISNISFASFGSYVATVVTQSGSFTTEPAVLSDRDEGRAPVLVRQSDSEVSYVGNDWTVQVTAQGEVPLTYQWSKDGTALAGATNDTLGIDPLKESDAGAYTVRVSNRHGSVTTSAARLQVRPAVPPIIRYQPKGGAYLAGAEVELTVLERYAGRATYQWKRNGTPVPGATLSTLKLSRFSSATAGRYTAAVTNGAGQTTVSDEALVALPFGDPGTFSLQPVSKTLRVGESTTLFAVGQEGEVTHYQWLKDDVPLVRERFHGLLLANVTVADAGRYRVEIRSLEDEVLGSSAEAIVTVTPGIPSPLAPLIVAPPAATTDRYFGDNENREVGETIVLITRVVGSPEPTLQWLKNGVPVTGATSATLTLTNVRVSDTGSYSVVVTNASGAVRSIPKNLVVTTHLFAPVISLPVAATRSVELGGTLTLQFSVEANPPATFSWRKDGLPARVPAWTAGSLTSLIIPAGNPVSDAGPGGDLDRFRATGAQISDAGVYTLHAGNSRGSILSRPISVEVRPPEPVGIYFTGPPTIPGSGLAAAFYVGSNRKVTFLVVTGAGAPSAMVATDVPVSSKGDFAVSIPIASFPPTSAHAIDGTTRGDSLIASRISQSGAIVATRSSAQGAFAAEAGYWTAPLAGAVSGVLHAIVNAAGDVIVAVSKDGVASASVRSKLTSGGLLELGAFSPVFRSLTARFNGATSTFSGNSTSSTGAVSFAGSRVGAPPLNRLANIATRGLTSGGTETMIAGFVVSGAASRPVLIRAIGPTLANFGVTGALPNPRLELFRGATRIAENDEWAAGADRAEIVETTARVGGFALDSASRDAVILSSLSPGSYSAQISVGGNSPGTGSGVALVEVYDAGEPDARGTAPRVINISTRGRVGAAQDALIAGLVVTGDAPKRLLIRGVGPGLAAFGVTGTLADPVLRLFRGSVLMDENDNWQSSAELVAATNRVGGFVLPNGSLDSVLLVTLAPGAYSAQLSGGEGSAGVALIEIYEVGDAP